MAVFPLFIDLKGRKCIIIGGGSVAERKIDTLLMFDAAITVISPAISDRILQLEREGRISVIRKRYDSNDLEEAFIVIAATSDIEVNESVYNDASSRGALVNMADCPHKCTFIFPAVVKRGDMVIGISTGGGYPALSKYIRKKLERLFPDNFGSMLEILREYRVKALRHIIDPEKRKEFLTEILEGNIVESIESIDDFRTKIDIAFKEYSGVEDYFSGEAR